MTGALATLLMAGALVLAYEGGQRRDRFVWALMLVASALALLLGSAVLVWGWP